MKNQLLETFSCGFGFNFDNGRHEVSQFRRFLPQFIATLAVFLTGWNMGFILAIATIVVPSVTGNSNKLNPDENLFMTEDEASWLGKDLLIFLSSLCFMNSDGHP